MPLSPEDQAAWDSESQQEGNAQKVQTSLNYGLDYDPDQRARTQALAAANGVGPSIVQGNESAFTKAAQMNGFDFDSFIKNTPRTADWMSAPENAAVAHDDIGNMAAFEKSLGGHETEGFTQFPNGVTLRNADQAVWLPSVQKWVNKDASGDFVPTGDQAFDKAGLWNSMNSWSATPSERKLLYQLKGAPSSALASLRGALFGTVWRATGGAVGFLKNLTQASDQWQEKQYGPGFGMEFKDLGVPQYLQKLQDLNQQNIDANAFQAKSLSDVHGFGDLVKAGASLAGGVAPYMAGPAALPMFLDAYGRRSQALEAQGVTPGQNLALSATAAIPDLAIGLAHGEPGFASVMKSLVQVPASTALAFTAKHFGDTAVDEMLGIAGKPNPDETFGEFLQRAWKNGGADSAMSGYLLSVLPMILPTIDQARQNGANQRLFKSIQDFGQNSKLVERLPAAAQDYVRRVTAGGPVDHVEVAPEAIQRFYQSKGMNDQQTAQEVGKLGVPAQDYLDSLATGDRVVIPIDQFTAHVAPNPELMGAIKDDFAFRPGESTNREMVAQQADAAQHLTDLEKTTQQIDQRTIDGLQNPDSLATYQKIKDDVRAQLAGVVDEQGKPRFSPAVQDMYATLAARGFVVPHDRAGIDPAAEYPSYGLNIFGSKGPEWAHKGTEEPTLGTGATYGQSEGNPLAPDSGRGEEGQQHLQPGAQGRYREGGRIGQDPVIAARLRKFADAARDGYPFDLYGSDIDGVRGDRPDPGTSVAFGGERSGQRIGGHTFGDKVLIHSVEPGPNGEHAYIAGTIRPDGKFQIGGMKGGDIHGIGTDLYQSLGKYLVGQHPDVTDVEGLAGGTADNPDGVVRTRNAFNDTQWADRMVSTPVKSLAEGPAPRGEILHQTEGPFIKAEPGEGDHQGYIQFGDDGKVSIGLLKKADTSTFLHEMHHMWVKMLANLAGREDAAPQVKEDFKALLDSVGAKDYDSMTVDQQEQLAKMGEKYFMEGKAPSQDLQGVFSKFAGWLKLIKNKLTGLGVDLSPQVKGVFDRLYATDHEIAAAREREGQTQPMFKSAEEMGMAPSLYEVYKKTVGQIYEKGQDVLRGQLMEDWQREYESKWQEERGQIRHQALESLKDQPIYRTHDILTKGEMEDGTPIKLDRAQLVERIGEEATKNLERENGGSGRAVYAREGGMDLDTAAELLGHGSGDELARGLRDMESRKAAADRIADQEMRARHGDKLTDGTLHDAADEAIQNSFKEDALSMEVKALLRLAARRKGQADELKGEAASKDFWARGVLREMPSLDTFRTAAANKIQTMAPDDITPSRFLDTQRRLSKEAFAAMGKGDYEAAAAAKQQELLNHFLFREAVKARANVGKLENLAESLAGTPSQKRLGLTDQSSGSTFKDQINTLLGRYGLTGDPQGAGPDHTSLSDWVAEQTALNRAPAIDPAILNEGRVADYHKVPMSELQAVRDALVNIRHLARQENTVRIGDLEVDRDQMMSELHEALRSSFKTTPLQTDPNIQKTFAEVAASKLRSADAMLLRMEQMVNWADENDVNGPWHKYLWNPIAEAQGREGDMAKEITAKLQEAMEAMPKDQRESLLDKFTVPGMKDQVTRKYLISMLFNMGNEVNRDKMIKGMGWAANPEILADAFSHLNSHDAKFVQDTWNTIGTLWPHMAELDRRMTGLEPVHVEAAPFRLKLADGDYDFQGGYYPLKGDPIRSRTGARQADAPLVNLTDKGFDRPQTITGHLKERTGATYPLLMDFESILGRHVTQAIQDITHREAVGNAYQIISDPEIRTTLAETLGEERMKQFMPWLKSVVNDRNNSSAQGLDAWSKFLGAARRNTVTATMGYKLSTALVQYTGITRSLHYVGAGDLLGALGQFMAAPTETTNMVRELSAEMRNRAENLDRDYSEMMRDQTGQNGFLAAVNRFAFHGIGMADTGIGVPTWLAAFNKAGKEGKDQATAILEADRAVRLTQPTAGAKDLPAIMRQNDAAKLATMFYGHFSVLYQNLRDAGHDVNGASDMPKFAARVLFSAMIPAVIGELTLARGPEGDEDNAKWAILRSLHFASSSIPLLRDVAIAVTNHIEGKQSDYRFSPVVDLFKKNADMLEAMAGSAGMEKADHPLSDTTWKTVEALGYDLGIPGTAQAMGSLKYLSKVNNGETSDTLPQAAAHLAFGYHKPKGGN